MKNEIICIACPIGCHLTITTTNNGSEISVSGNKCPRGEGYGKEETLSPKRVVTAVVKSDSGILPYIPVKTSKPLQKELINDLLQELYCITLKSPIQSGNIVISNFRDTGVDLLTTRQCAETPANEA